MPKSNPKNNPMMPTMNATKNTRLKGWDIMKILTDKKGRSKEVKSHTKQNPISQPKTRQDGLKHL